MKFVTASCIALIAVATAQPIPFEPPYCGDVWNPAAPPAVASATVIGTVAYLDSTGYFSDQAGVAVLGGTTPWEIYLKVAIASSFGALDGSSTAAQTQCLAIFEIALGGTNAFSPVIVAESVSGPWTRPWTTLEGYIYSQPFAEHRMCPCYNMMPRELFENMNCRPTPDAVSMSQNYLHCQAVDTAPHYAEVAASANYTFAAPLPLNRDESQIENWQGCMDPSYNTFFTEDCVPSTGCYDPGATMAAAYATAVTTYNMGSGSSYVPPSSTNPFDFLDTVAGTCITMPGSVQINGESCPSSAVVVTNPTSCIQGAPHYDPEGAVCANDNTATESYCSYEVGAAACAYCSGSAPTDTPVTPAGRHTGEGGGKGMMGEGGGKGMGGGEGGSKGMGGGSGKGEGGSKGMGGSGKGEGGRKGHGAQMTASFASKVNSPQGVGAMVGVIALVAGTAFVAVRRARNRAVDVESQSDETTALVSDVSGPAII